MNRYDGKNVLMTGAASGIGRATAQRLVEEGANVLALDIDPDGLSITSKSVIAPERFDFAEVDLSNEAGIVAAVSAAASRLGGRIDVLVNVAGMIRATPATTWNTDVADRLFRVNFYGPVLMCRESLPHLPDGAGAIVNVTSVSATKAHPGLSAYAATKGALLSYSFSLAAELTARRIRVVAVSPGGVATPLTANADTYSEVDTSWYSRVHPLWGEPGKPEDIAAMIALAGSADGNYLNGIEVRVDGGSHV